MPLFVNDTRAPRLMRTSYLWKKDFGAKIIEVMRTVGKYVLALVIAGALVALLWLGGRPTKSSFGYCPDASGNYAPECQNKPSK